MVCTENRQIKICFNRIVSPGRHLWPVCINVSTKNNKTNKEHHKPKEGSPFHTCLCGHFPQHMYGTLQTCLHRSGNCKLNLSQRQVTVPLEMPLPYAGVTSPSHLPHNDSMSTTAVISMANLSEKVQAFSLTKKQFKKKKERRKEKEKKEKKEKNTRKFGNLSEEVQAFSLKRQYKLGNLSEKVQAFSLIKKNV